MIYYEHMKKDELIKLLHEKNSRIQQLVNEPVDISKEDAVNILELRRLKVQEIDDLEFEIESSNKDLDSINSTIARMKIN